MAIPPVRIRKEEFGYTLAFANGELDWYDDSVGPLLLKGTTKGELDEHRIESFPLHDNFHLSAPLVAWIELTRACNLPCKHCYISAGRPRAHELSTSEILSLLEQLKAQGVLVVVFLGGEPTLHPGFTRIVQYAHELGLVLSIGSNGTYINQELIDALPREECFVSVSLDGVQFQQELRVGSTFDDIRARLLLLKQNAIPTGIMCVLTDRNADEVEEILDFAIEHDFYFGSTPFSPIGRGQHYPELLPGPHLAAQTARLYERDAAHEQRMMAKTGLCFTKVFQKCYVISKATRREFCGTALVYIQSDGDVYPCTTCSSARRFRAGNVRESTFSDIWEHGFRNLRAISWDDFAGCKTCDLAQEPYFCTARCPVLSEVYTGDPLQCGSTPYLMESLRIRTKVL